MSNFDDMYSYAGCVGSKPLGDYSATEQQIKLLYSLAFDMQQGGEVYANIDMPNDNFAVGQGDEAAAMLYGLKPYIVMQPFGTPTSLVQNKTPVLDSNMQQDFLRSLLRKIVEEV